MPKTYVPGYGWVESEDPGTSGSVWESESGNYSDKRYDSGQGSSYRTYGNYEEQRAAKAGASNQPKNPSMRGAASGGVPGIPPPEINNTTNPPFIAQPTEGVAMPLDGGPGYAYGARAGFNPDRLERFPYGVDFKDRQTAVDSFLLLDPAYQNFLNDLAKNPVIGTYNSTGRMLWERLSNLAEESTAMGDARSPHMLAAELAQRLGVEFKSTGSKSRDLLSDITGSSSSSSGASFSFSSYSGGGRSGGSGGGGGGGGGGGNTVTQTNNQTQTRVDLTNPTSARGVLIQTFQNLLGRDPTVEEQDQFRKMLKEAERGRPVVVKSTTTAKTTTSDDGTQQTTDSDSDVKQKGGVDPGVIAQQFAKSMPDYGEYQGNQYAKYIMAALVGGGV